jgi:hypothetical protein
LPHAHARRCSDKRGETGKQLEFGKEKWYGGSEEDEMVMRGETRDAGMRGETGKELEFGKEQW